MKENLNLQDSSKIIVDYATVDQLYAEISARKSGDNLNSNNISSLTNDYVPFKSWTNVTLNLKQNKTDPTLHTTDKTVVGAINEVFRMIEDLQNQSVSSVNLKVQAKELENNIAPQELIESLTTEINWLNAQISEKEKEIEKILENFKIAEDAIALN